MPVFWGNIQLLALINSFQSCHLNHNKKFHWPENLQPPVWCFHLFLRTCLSYWHSRAQGTTRGWPSTICWSSTPSSTLRLKRTQRTCFFFVKLISQPLWRGTDTNISHFLTITQSNLYENDNDNVLCPSFCYLDLNTIFSMSDFFIFVSIPLYHSLVWCCRLQN